MNEEAKIFQKFLADGNMLAKSVMKFAWTKTVCSFCQNKLSQRVSY